MTMDLSLYLIADPDQCGGRPPVEVVEAAVAGGVTLVQLRCKAMADETVLALGRALMDVLGPRDIPLIVNDRADIARALGAAGVHLGQDDGDPGRARAVLGPRGVIGLSIGTEAELRASDLTQVNYVGSGPVFATASKSDAGLAIGPEGAAAIKALARRPTVGIGGIGAGNAAQVIAAGLDGVAVLSAVCAAADPRAAAAALRRAVDEARRPIAGPRRRP
jgi:thiamine-phosphate pyrophosphorylase